MRKVFTEAVSEEDLVAVAKAMTDKAKQGDVAAARLVLSYVVGKPLDAVEPDTLNLEELKHYEEETKHFKALPAVAAAPDLEMVCTIARSTRPSIAEAASKDISHALLNGELPAGSPFRGPDSLECQEATDSDNPPLENGDNGLPEGDEAGALPGPEALKRGQELLEELGLAGAGGQKPGVQGPAVRPQVDAQVVAMAVMMLYEAMLVANGGNNPFLALEEGLPREQAIDTTPSANPDTGKPAIDQPPPSPNAANGGDVPPRGRGRPA
jgi:hypothetical protein